MKKFIFVLLFLFPLSESVGSESNWNMGYGVGSKNYWDMGYGVGSKNYWNMGLGLTFPYNPMIDVCLGLRGSGNTLPSICNYITPK